LHPGIVNVGKSTLSSEVSGAFSTPLENPRERLIRTPGLSLILSFRIFAASGEVMDACPAETHPEAIQGSALLQVRSEDRKKPMSLSLNKVELLCSGEPKPEQAHLIESRACVNVGLQEAHLRAIRRNAALMTFNSRIPSEADGTTAELDGGGFLEVTSLCCPSQMEIFFKRLLEDKGLQVCSWPHIQGLMHWFTCVPGMEFQYVLDVIDNGNPCKYWTEQGSVCPALTPPCNAEWCR
jgi:hypothetical protein